MESLIENCSLLPSLKRIVFVKIAIAMWNKKNEDLISKLSYTGYSLDGLRKRWEMKGVYKMIRELILPEPLIYELENIFLEIGWLIFLWKEFHRKILGLEYTINSIDKICWKPQGIIDKKKTAEILVKDETLTLSNRYHLACIYCLKNDIYVLWKKLDPNFKRPAYILTQNKMELIIFWSFAFQHKIHYLRKRMKSFCLDENVTPLRYALWCAIYSGNEVATKFFWDQIKFKGPNEDSLLIKIALVLLDLNHLYLGIPGEHYPEFLWFLFSLMNKNQIEEVIRCRACHVLLSFFIWPWQDIFMKLFEHVWQYLSESDYNKLLCAIINKLTSKFQDYNYQKIFEVVWQKTPLDVRRNHISWVSRRKPLIKFILYIQNGNLLRLVLKDFTPLEKKKIILNKVGIIACKMMACYNNWNLLEFFIRDCLSSQIELITFKHQFIKIAYYEPGPQELYKLDKCLDLLVKFIEDCDKICEDKHYPAKIISNSEHEITMMIKNKMYRERAYF